MYTDKTHSQRLPDIESVPSTESLSLQEVFEKLRSSYRKLKVAHEEYGAALKTTALNITEMPRQREATVLVSDQLQSLLATPDASMTNKVPDLENMIQHTDVIASGGGVCEGGLCFL